MRFSDLRDRIILLKPDYHFTNSMSEMVPAWVSFSPYQPELTDNPPVLTVTDGAASPEYAWGKTSADAAKYKIWAAVAPTVGREYEEAQKIRAETTYKVRLRYAPGIQSDCKVLYRNRILNVESVLNIEERDRELQLVCAEVDRCGKETD